VTGEGLEHPQVPGPIVKQRTEGRNIPSKDRALSLQHELVLTGVVVVVDIIIIIVVIVVDDVLLLLLLLLLLMFCYYYYC
jgi:uncharacterized membrane protein